MKEKWSNGRSGGEKILLFLRSPIPCCKEEKKEKDEENQEDSVLFSLWFLFEKKERNEGYIKKYIVSAKVDMNKFIDLSAY